MVDNTLHILTQGAEMAQLEAMIRRHKGSASKIERQEFIETWMVLAGREGLVPQVVELLARGFDIAQAEPLYRFVSRTNDDGAYKRLYASLQRRSKAEATLKIVLSLLAYELMNPTSESSIDSVALWLSTVAVTTSGKPQRSLTDNVGKILVGQLSSGHISEHAHVEPSKARSLDNHLRSGLDAAIKKPRAKPNDVRAAEELIEWLEIQKNSDVHSPRRERALEELPSVTANQSDHESERSAEQTPAITDAKPSESNFEATRGNEDPAGKNADVNLEVVPVTDAPGISDRSDHDEGESGVAQNSNLGDHQTTEQSDKATVAHGYRGKSSVSATTVNEPQHEESARPAKESAKKAGTRKARGDADAIDMKTVIAFLSQFQKDHVSLQKQLDAARSENKELMQNVGELEQALKSAQWTIDDLKDQRTALSSNYTTLQQQYEALKVENQALRDDLESANEMIDMIDESSAHEAESVIGSLGRELSYDYRKFLSAADQPMTEELGIIVLDQLRTVFEILKKHGVELQ